MASEKALQTLQERLNASLETPAADLVTKPQWGSINFEAARPDLERALDMMRHLRDLPVNILPEQTVNRLSDDVQEMRGAIDQLRTFSIESGGDPNARRNELVNQIRSQSDKLFIALQGFIPFLAYQKGDVAKNIADLSAAVEQSRQLIKAGEDAAADSKKKLDDVIRAAQDAAAVVGVGHFTTDFLQEAAALQNIAWRWLVATMILGGSTLLAAGLILYLSVDGAVSVERVAAGAIPKVAVLALLFTATLWCGRIYKARVHQAVLNRHRGNALKTFQAFVKATDDDQIRNAVLLETTRSIFTVAPSGFIDPKAEPDSPSTIIEMVRDGSKRGGS